jgi:hypothetical protein
MSHAEEIDIAGFIAFTDWLWGLGVGMDKANAMPTWSETWRGMEAGELADLCLGIARGPAMGTLTIKVLHK